MAAMRYLLSTLNGLAQSGLMASGWLRSPENDDATAPTDASAGGSSREQWDDYTQGGVEPPLEELLDDPVVHLMMRADHLDPDEVRRLLTSR